jgi:hypothetical protein
MKKWLLFLVLIPLICSSQDIVLKNINIPGAISVGVINGAVLSENLIGPRKVIFEKDPNKMIFQKTEERKSFRFGEGSSVSDKLTTLYSGKIFSPGILEPFIFENKTPEELSTIEVTVYPTHLEQPYTLFIDLKVQTSSKPVIKNQNDSDDAGTYNAKINISLIEI